MAERFTKRPIEVEAIQWTGDNDEAIRTFSRRAQTGWPPDGVFQPYGQIRRLWVKASGSWALIQKWDWVIKEPHREGVYPCTNEDFLKTYDPVPPGVRPTQSSQSISEPEMTTVMDFRTAIALIDRGRELLRKALDDAFAGSQ